MNLENSAFSFACPACRLPLVTAGDEARHSPNTPACPAGEHKFERIDGIWRFLLPGRVDAYRQFIADYETIRLREGRGDEQPSYYRSLPYQDITGRFSKDWAIRARSFKMLTEKILLPFEKAHAGPLAILDLGAGNGWLSNRLAERGHYIAALDLLVNAWDGLGAWVHYDTAFTRIQAEFERLPFLDAQIDLVIFNASLHYATRYEPVLQEARRALRPGGRLVVMDTPVYNKAESGAQMVAERRVDFLKRYGLASDSLPSQNFLTWKQVEELGLEFGLSWEVFRPRASLRGRVSPLIRRLRGLRELATFPLLAGVLDG